MPPPQVYGYHLPQGSIAGSGGLQPGNRTPHTTYLSGGLPGTATTTRSWSRHQCNCVVSLLRIVYDLMRNSERLFKIRSVSIFSVSTFNLYQLYYLHIRFINFNHTFFFHFYSSLFIIVIYHH